MPCTNCMVNFSPFRKEHGCSSCSFSFCAKCLPQKIVLPQLSKEPVSVCQNCYDKLTRKITVENVEGHRAGISPPPYSACQRNDRLLPSNSTNITVSIAGAHNFVSRARPSREDEEIERRLENLRQSGSLEPNALSVTEIEERLAKLRGVSVEKIRSPSLLFSSGRVDCPQENVKMLIEKAMEEAEIERKWDPVERLQDRYDDYYGISRQKDDGKTLKGAVDGKRADFDSDLFGEGTVKNLKELNKTIVDYKAASNQSDSPHDEQLKLEDEMKEILRITRQKSQKTEKINAEMAKFWHRISNDSSEDEGERAHDSNNDVDEEELKHILVEAEKAVAQENKVVREAKKKQRRSIFSKLFRSVDS